VLIAAPLDQRSRMYRLLVKHAALVECGVIETQADGERWIKNRVTAAGAQIDPAGARLLAERSGADVKRLRNDVERLLLYALGQKTISLDDVRQIVGPATLQDDWAMTGREGARPARLAGADEVSGDCAGRPSPGDRSALSNRSRPEAVGRRSAHPARTADRRVVYVEAGTGVRPLLTWRRGASAAATCTGRRHCDE
jgi:hypothetical protein